MSRSSLLPVIQDCSGCGVCCFHMGFPAFMEPVESSYDAVYWRAMPEELQQELREHMAADRRLAPGELDGPCIWLDLETRRCKHHQWRPRVCRDFPVGGAGCREWRRHYRDRILDSAETAPGSSLPMASGDAERAQGE